MTVTDRPLYAVDAGGSRTSVAAFNGDRWSGPSVNPSSVGAEMSARRIRDLLAEIRSHATGMGRPAKPVVWVASASLDPRAPVQETARFGALAHSAGLLGELVVSNDVTPLVLAPSGGAGQVVAVCGTGSSFAASNGHNPPVQIGGCEYLASDEGSAFDLGLHALRAAVRGLDGRGPSTTLIPLLETEAGVSVRDLARALASEPFPKTRVAGLAPFVVQAWLGGDAVAAELVQSAISELVLGVRAARDIASLSTGWRLVVTGGVMTASAEFYARFAAQAGEPLGAGTVDLVPDPAVAVLGTLARVAAKGDVLLPRGWLGQHAWRIYLDDGGPGDET